MLSYSFSNRRGRPLYEHLYQCLKQDIIEGKLPASSRLPSKRSFAANLGVSTITVENAYAQLVSEGYIYALPKKGYYVSDISELMAFSDIPSTEIAHAKSRTPEEAVSGINPDSRDSYDPEEDNLHPSPPVFADFSSNQTRPENFPFSVWARLLRQILSGDDHALMTKTPSGGIMGLREAIAGHLRQFRGMQVQPEQIFLGAGTEYLYGLLIQLLGFDKTYAIENPGYEKISQIYDSYHVHKINVDMDERGIRVDQLDRSGADVVHISPSHHFPTGIITPISRRYELLFWADRSEKRYIIEDDFDSEFRLTGKPIPALQSIDKNQKVIYINTFSKSLASTMRISYMVLPVKLARRFRSEMGFYSCTVSSFEQHTLMHFIREGYFEKHINRMRNYYHKQRDRLLGAIKNSPLASITTIREEDAGLHFLLKIDTGLPDHIITKRASDQGIILKSLSDYYDHAPADAAHTFIINYSYIEPHRIEEAVERLYRCVRP
ncbi:MAG: PLP-dependent aminotransferase family protein [Eubacterium sp.]|nr:PLP-dependent aminotransferase family protein [Eubacterium sp.]